MLNFTSSLYLGMRHESWSLQPWMQLTTGVPAALAPPPGERRVAESLAELQGCESAVLATSTLHLFWDLFGMLSGEKIAVFMDSGVYPVARWGVERAVSRGVPARSFSHHDPDSLRHKLRGKGLSRLRPLVVTDGFCPACGEPAPIASYIEITRTFGGYLIIDDTQALGILGYDSEPGAPYGRGGGGILRWSGVGGSDVLVISSLAKGFGVPVAALSASRGIVQRFEAESETRTHSSPPSIAVIHAAEHALAVNEEMGDALRLRLAKLVGQFRDRLRNAGFFASSNLFPVQTLILPNDFDFPALHSRLLQLGVHTVLHRSRNGNSPRISFIITARHTPREIDRAADILERATRIKKLKQSWR